MDLERLQGVLDCFFERAVIAISYSAAYRLLNRLTSSSAHGPNISLLVLGVTVVTLLLLSRQVRQNACLQTTLSILISKLVIYGIAPLEPTAYAYGWVLPGIICFFLCLYCSLCRAVRAVLAFPPLQTQWDLIVPFVVIFSTTAILRAIQSHGELHFLYAAVLCHLLWWTTLEIQGDGYLHQFVDSIMARGILLVLDDLIFGSAIRPGIGLCFLFAIYILLLNICFPSQQRSRPCQVCIGVLTYSLCSRILEALKLLCNQQIGITFAVVASLLVLLLYQPRYLDFTSICSNALSILWSNVLDSWVFSFYQEWEQILMYMIIFGGMQGLKDALTPALQKSAALLLLVVVPPTADTEAMLIARESDMHADHVLSTTVVPPHGATH